MNNQDPVQHFVYVMYE